MNVKELIDNVMSRITKIERTLMTCLQKNRGTKNWMDIDFDVPKDIFNAPKLMEDYLQSKELLYYWIDTHSGFRLSIDRSTIKFDPNDICKEGMKKLINILKSNNMIDNLKYNEEDTLWILIKVCDSIEQRYEIILNKNEMCVLPGTLSGNHKVKFI